MFDVTMYKYMCSTVFTLMVSFQCVVLLFQVELLDLFSSLNFNVLNHLESCCTEVQKGTNHFLGVSNEFFMIRYKASGHKNRTIRVQQLNKE